MNWKEHEAAYKAVETEYADYFELLKGAQESSGYCGPHCDQLVLHKPGDCHYCDMPDFKDLHAARLVFNIAHTGEDSFGKRPCPSTALRSLQQIERWPGNRPYPEAPETIR